jgi:hypothetical protein
MQENDYNIIKPVENLQNIGAMKPIDRETERRRRQGRQKQHSTATDQQITEEAGQNDSAGPGNNRDGQSSIDYRA